jgi:sec-independent protein translocase protein TatB
MFSIGFLELLVIAVILLLVVGPEKLPEAVRGISMNIARFQRYWARAKRDLEQELGLDDIRREIHNAEVMEHLRQTQKLLKEPLDAKSYTDDELDETRHMEGLASENQPGAERPAAPEPKTPVTDEPPSNGITPTERP